MTVRGIEGFDLGVFVFTVLVFTQEDSETAGKFVVTIIANRVLVQTVYFPVYECRITPFVFENDFGISREHF
jgi:hypothetical protein